MIRGGVLLSGASNSIQLNSNRVIVTQIKLYSLKMVKQITAQFDIDGSGVDAVDHDNPITLCLKR